MDEQRKETAVGETNMLKVAIAPLEGQRMGMSKAPATRVVLADDHDVVRQGLKRLLDRVPEIEVIGEASDGLEALQSVQELQPDVLLLDIEMPISISVTFWIFGYLVTLLRVKRQGKSLKQFAV